MFLGKDVAGEPVHARLDDLRCLRIPPILSFATTC